MSSAAHPGCLAARPDRGTCAEDRSCHRVTTRVGASDQGPQRRHRAALRAWIRHLSRATTLDLSPASPPMTRWQTTRRWLPRLANSPGRPAGEPGATTPRPYVEAHPPGHRPALGAQCQAGPFHRPIHVPRSVHVDGLLPEQSVEEVRHGYRRPHPPVVPGVDEPVETPRPGRREPHERGHARIAAEDPIERDHVGRLDLRCEADEVALPVAQPSGMAAPLGLFPRRGHEGGRAVDVDGAGEARREQLVMDGADAAADVDQRPRVAQLGFDQLEQQTGRAVRALAPVRGQLAMGGPLVEVAVREPAIANPTRRAYRSPTTRSCSPRAKPTRMTRAPRSGAWTTSWRPSGPLQASTMPWGPSPWDDPSESTSSRRP